VRYLAIFKNGLQIFKNSYILYIFYIYIVYRMNVNSLVLVNGNDENGINYKNEPAVILVVSDDIYLVKFIRTHIGNHHYVHGDNTAEISGLYLTPAIFGDVVKILNIDSSYVNAKINAIIAVPPLSLGDLVIVNGRDTMGRNHIQVPAILVSDQNNQFMVRFLDSSLDNETYSFLDRRSLNKRNKITQLDEIAQILRKNVDDVKNLISGITLMHNLPHFKGGRKKKSNKKRSHNRKRYNSFKKISYI